MPISNSFEVVSNVLQLHWLPNSPDVNPVDYKIWRVMQESHVSKANNINPLKDRLVEE